MKIEDLFDAYDVLVTNKIDSEKIFNASGMTNVTRKLDLGFFPLGSGILTEGQSKIEGATINEGETLVLGNDFGTVTYLETKCKGNREDNSKTIKNLLSLGISTCTTFFTNFYLGLRKDSLYQGTTMTKRIKNLEQEYKDLCFNFFRIQIEMINPRIVICLGTQVGQTLSEYSEVFKKFSKQSGTITSLYDQNNDEAFIIYTDDSIWGQRKFILIPHPSYAHINWKNDIRNQISKAIQE